MRKLISNSCWVAAFVLALVLFVTPPRAQLTLTHSGGGPIIASGGSCVGVHANNFLARTSGLSGPETTATCNLINQFDTDGTFSLFDFAYLFSTNTKTTGKLNLVGTTFPITENGTCTFTGDLGYTGDGSTCFLDTTLNPTAGGVNFVQNSATLGACVTNNRTTSNTGVSIGAGNGSAYAYLQPLLTAGTLKTNFELNGNTFPSVTNTTAQGALTVDRTTSLISSLYINGVLSFGPGDVSSGLLNGNIYILAFNGAGSDFSTDTVAYAFAGAGLGSTNVGKVYSAFHTAMTALGVPGC